MAVIDSLSLIFIEEAQELLEQLENGLLTLEQDPENSQEISAIFRSLHTIKGAGGMAGFTAISELVHDVEAAYELIRSGSLYADRAVIDQTLAVADQVRAHIAEAVEGGTVDHERDVELREFFKALRSQDPPVSMPAPEPVAAISSDAPSVPRAYQIRYQPSRDLFRRGSSPLMILRELSDLGEVDVVLDAGPVPSLDQINPEDCWLAWDIRIETAAGMNALLDVFLFSDEEEYIITDITPEEPKAVTPLSPPGVPVQTASAAQKEAASESVAHGDQEQTTIRVRPEKIDRLVDMVGELVTVQSHLGYLAEKRQDPEVLLLAEEVERLSWEMSQQILTIRKAPLESIYTRFYRLVRDHANELGKYVYLDLQGGEVEIDRTLLAPLATALQEVVLNAISHGIELPAEREAIGKAQEGMIRITAEPDGDEILLRVTDDGRGFDSSATGRDDAGRGEGLSWVARELNKVRASLTLTSDSGEGTSATIRIPVTNAIFDGLLVWIGSTSFVLPIHTLEEIVEIPHLEASCAKGGSGTVIVREEQVPYLCLRNFFQLGCNQEIYNYIVVVRIGQRRLGFLVDRVEEDHQTVIKPLGRMFSAVPGFAGATILGDGSCSLVLDPLQIAQSAGFAETVFDTGEHDAEQQQAGYWQSSMAKVRTDRLDLLVNMVGELVVVQSQLARIADERDDMDLYNIAEEVERLTWELSDNILSIRMVPIGTLFRKFDRLVKDLARDLGKEIHFSLEGGETELDTNVVEHLTDPLIHLLRNALDHGIEPPETRILSGKHRAGTITVAARHSGGNVLVEIIDDGGGLNRDSIRKKAIERGLIDPQEALPDNELYQLICHPGFSTASAVTAVSGRGVGMDVVKRSIEDMGGSLVITSAHGKGTTFRLAIPLTMAIVHGLLVTIGGVRYVFPLSLMEECVELDMPVGMAQSGRKLTRVEDELIPFIDLCDYFNLPRCPGNGQVVITRAGGERIGLLVDGVEEEYHTVIKTLGWLFRTRRELSGATILGDGTVALVIDPEQIVRQNRPAS